MKTALMSIHEPYAKAIFNGAKTYEFRRKAPRLDTPFKMLIYVPGRRKLSGEAIVWKIIQGSPRQVWRLTGKKGGIRKADFDAYFAGRDTAYALALRKVSEYAHPATLDELRETVVGGFFPPQYLRWMSAEALESLPTAST